MVGLVHDYVSLWAREYCLCMLHHQPHEGDNDFAIDLDDAKFEPKLALEDLE